MDLSLTEWLSQTEGLRLRLLAYDKMPLPSDAHERHCQLDEAIQAKADAGRLLADAKTYLLHEKGAALLAMRDKYPDMNASERSTMEKAETADLERIVAGLAISKSVLSDRVFSIQNENRASR